MALAIFTFTEELTVGVYSMCATLSDGYYVSHVELSHTLGISITPAMISQHSTRGSFKLAFANDDANDERVQASFRTAAFFEIKQKCKIPVLVMCNGCAVVSLLHILRDCNDAHPKLSEFCTAVVTQMARFLLPAAKRSKPLYN